MQTVTSLAGVVAFAMLTLALIFTDRLSSNQWLLVLGAAWILLLVASRTRLPQRLPTFNRSLIRTTLVIATVFIVISAQLVRIQIVDSNVTYSRTAVAPDGEILGNPRVATSELSIERGEIFDRNGVAIAETEREGDIYVRTYPDPATSYVAGYYSPLLYGSAGLESTYNDELTGETGNDPFDRMLNSLLNRPQQGADLRLTLDSGLQQQAMNLMGESNGSVVVMDAGTGEVIVLASNPNYDPNRIFTASTAESDEATAYWETLIENDDAPLVLRATLGLFTPGSTFKTITAAIGLELGLIEPDEVFEDNGELNIDGRILVENNRPDDSRDQWTVREGIAWSLNVVFAQIGLRIGANDLWNSGQALGFGQDIPFDLPVAESQIASSREFLEDDNAVADTAFGQGQLLVTPLHMCVVTAMFANEGEMMRPYLVDAVLDESGRVNRRTEPAAWLDGLSPETASQVEEMMVNAVENGTVTRAQMDGYTVGGKTGTAETGDGSAHSWFVGFIGEGESRYAVAVVLEQGSGGLTDAVTIGRDMLYATITSPISGN
ncbi:MAG: penicillin-binding protein 2 [Chloroflexota bacterium]|nr:penicillin-binding protein 2 [Chloroflexota bacterium]